MLEQLPMAIPGALNDPVVATVIGLAPEILEKVSRAKDRFLDKRNLGALVKEYAFIADCAGCPTLASRMRMKSFMSELEENCKKGEAKEALARAFLADADMSVEERSRSETLCSRFIDDYFEAVNVIRNTEHVSVVARLNEGRNATEARLSRKLDYIAASIADDNVDARLILGQIVSCMIGYEQVAQYVRGGGRASDLSRALGAYYDTCEGRLLADDDVASVCRFPEFAVHMLGLLVSAWRIEDYEMLARRIGGATWEDACRIMPVLCGEAQVSDLAPQGVLTGFNDTSHAMLCVAELAYWHGEYDSAARAFSLSPEKTNLLARAHEQASLLMVGCQNEYVNVTSVENLLQSMPDSLSAKLGKGVMDALNSGLSMLDEREFESVWSGLSSEVQMHCELARRMHSLANAASEDLWDSLLWASKHGHYGLLVSCSEKLLSNPDYACKVRRYWNDRTYMLCEEPFLLEFYLLKVGTNVRPQEARDLACERADDPSFNLVLAWVYSGEKGFTEHHTRLAIDLMRSGHGVDVMHMNVWLPHLVKLGKVDVVIEILRSIGLLPQHALTEALVQLLRAGASPSVLRKVADELDAWETLSHPKGLYYLAAICFGEENYDNAIGYAKRSFALQPNCSAAELIANASNILGYKAEVDVLEYLVSADTSRTLFFAAGQLKLAGDWERADDLLVRSVLLDGDSASWSAACLIGEWAGGRVEDRTTLSVGPDSAVTYEDKASKKHTVAFHSSARRIPGGRILLDGCEHVTTASSEYAAFAGRGLGSQKCGDFGVVTILSVEPVESVLLRYCFAMVPSLPDVRVLRFGDDVVEQMRAIVVEREREMRPRIKLLREGIISKGGLVAFLGISSGSVILGCSPVELAFGIAGDKTMPLYRFAGNKEYKPKRSQGHLLSVSAILMLSLLAIEKGDLDVVSRCCRVSQATKVWLQREVHQSLSNTDRSTGGITADDEGHLILSELTEEDKLDMRTYASRVLRILEMVPACDEVVRLAEVEAFPRKLRELFGPRESQDWAIARKLDYYYVTEDHLEACVVIGHGSSNLCNITQVMRTAGLSELSLSRYSMRMHDLGCVPAVDETQARLASELLLDETKLTENERETVINYAIATGVIELRETSSGDAEIGGR